LLLNWIRWCFCRQLCHILLHPKVQEDVSSASSYLSNRCHLSILFYFNPSIRYVIVALLTAILALSVCLLAYSGISNLVSRPAAI
jgi:hypothetical protein